jgi:hypothetical protein
MCSGPKVPEQFLPQIAAPPAVVALPVLRPGKDNLRSDLFVDRLLDIRGVPDDVVAAEVAQARSRAGKYGTPVDPRKPVVHVDALMWIAALANASDRELFASEVMKFYAETPNRVPAADRYESDSLRASGTQARPVIGAVFAPFLLPPARAGR